jgi:two-component system phosphate regulon response regulator PhoB
VEPTERILVADDDIDMLHLVSVRLTAAGFDVLQATSGDSALGLAQAEMPTLSVLDVMMPGLSGLEVCRALRSNPRTARMPVILLSARAEEIDRILGLEMGADDYLTKPFSPRELLLRIESILSRQRRTTNGSDVLSVGKISLNREEHRIVSDGQPVNLTASEFRLLLALMENEGRVLTRDALLNRVWGAEKAIEPRTVDTHLRRLRDKLGGAGEQIRTVRGFGYRIEHE